jgi:transposase-like protein
MEQNRTEKVENAFFTKLIYSEELKHHVCQEYLQGEIGIRALTKKYNISSHSCIHSWLRKYGYVANSNENQVKFKTVQIGLENFGIVKDLNLGMSSQESTSPSSTDSEEVKRLKKELEDAKLKAEAYKRMIEIAEQEFNIPIGKKSNTK